jgi:hypothetical protein
LQQPSIDTIRQRYVDLIASGNRLHNLVNRQQPGQLARLLSPEDLIHSYREMEKTIPSCWRKEELAEDKVCKEGK